MEITWKQEISFLHIFRIGVVVIFEIKTEAGVEPILVI